jgi:hypothetical protein
VYANTRNPKAISSEKFVNAVNDEAEAIRLHASSNFGHQDDCVQAERDGERLSPVSHLFVPP